VHNCVGNKTKSGVNHFDKIYNKKVFNETKFKIIKTLHEGDMDFRKISMIKNALFDSGELIDNHLVPMHVWKQVLKEYCPNGELDAVEQMILQEVTTGDNINLMKFMDLLDLFTFLPIMKFRDRNDSSNLFMVMSSNTQTGATLPDKDTGGALMKQLDLLWITMQEKYQNINHAYRYFDVNFNGRVTFAEFQKGLDNLRIKYQLNEVFNMFKFLDRGEKGYISYLDFCGMAEERRRKLDAFDYE
jgi:Ca2+-binding EF-hand superfamily protein